jgi:DNA repair exonuclease SbcCD ATPase subunit
MGLEADTSKVAGQVEAAKAQIESAGGSAVTATDKVTAATKKQEATLSPLGEKLKGIKKTYGEQVEVVQGLIGKLFAVGAVAGTFFKIGEAISTHVIEQLKTASDHASDFALTINRADAKAAARQVGDELTKINAALADSYSTWNTLKQTLSFGMFGDDPQELLDRQKKLNDELAAFSNRIAKERRDKQAAEEEKLLADLAKLNQDAIRATMTEEEKIRAEAQDRIQAITDKYNQLNAESKIAAEQATADAIVAINQDTAARLAKIEEDRRKEEERKAKEAQQKKYDEERLLAELDEQGRAGRKRIDDEQQRRREAFEDSQAAVAEFYRKQKEDADKAAKDATDKMDAEQRRAHQVRQAWTNAYRAIREESNRAFATDQAASMVQLAGQLRIEGMTAAANMNQIIVQGVG